MSDVTSWVALTGPNGLLTCLLINTITGWKSFTRGEAEVRDEGDICGQERLKPGACISVLSTNFHHCWLPRMEDCNNPLSDVGVGGWGGGGL